MSLAHYGSRGGTGTTEKSQQPRVEERNGVKRGPVGLRAKRTCRSGRPGLAGLNTGGVWLMRGLVCSAEKEEYGEYRMVKGFGTTGGALLGGRPYPRSHNKKRVWNDMWSPVLRTLTQTRHLGARSGAWNDVRSAAWCRTGKERCYGLTRVVYPDPRSRSEKRGLERHGEPCVVGAVERDRVTTL